MIQGTRTRRAITSLGFASLLAVTAVGCSTSSAPDVAPTGVVESPSADPAVTDSYGDVIALREVTDAGGTYTQTTINPDAAALQFDAASVDISARDAGFTDAQLESAQKWVVTFVAEEQADSISVDSTPGWDEWQRDNVAKYLLPSYVDMLLAPAEDNGDRTGLIYNNPNDSVPPLVRDGKPRLSSTTITVSEVSGGADPAGSYVWVGGKTAVEYRVSDQEAQKFAQTQNPGLSAEELQSRLPALYDGDINPYSVNMEWGYAVLPAGDSWQIGGYNNQTRSPGFLEALEG